MRTIQDCLDAYQAHTEQVGCRNTAIPSVLKVIGSHLGARPVADLTTQDIEGMIAAEQQKGKRPSTVQSRVSYLHAAMRYAQQCGKLASLPYFPTLKFYNARTGFFEAEEFQAILSHLAEPYADIARLGYETGWRLSEILGLHWSQVDRHQKTITLGVTKNGHGRVLPLSNGRAAVIERRQQVRTYGNRLVEWVFHVEGERITRDRFWRAWVVAREAAGLPTKLFHDLRRTAARDMIAAGLDYQTAMQITGHRTMSMFLRYQITDLRSLSRGLDALDTHRQRQIA